MKTKIYSIIAGLLLTASVFAQAPQKMTYQAVVRNSSDALVQSSPVGMKVSILQGSVTGTPVYVETHTTQTNQNGLLNIEIGGGTVVSGIYQNGIYWAGGPYYLKTEIDPLGGTAYTITSTSELLSVPYSNYSHVSSYADSSFTSASISGIDSGLTSGIITIPTNTTKRPKKITIKYITNVQQITTDVGFPSYPPAFYALLCEGEWYDDNRDGLGNLLYKTEFYDPTGLAVEFKRTEVISNTNKIGEIKIKGISIPLSSMQQIIISFNLPNIIFNITPPLDYTDIWNGNATTREFKIIGPYSVLYNIEW